MPLDPAVLFGAFLSCATGLIGWWAKTLAEDLKRARDDTTKTQAALDAHKLYAAETYVRETDLQKLRTELIGHLERIERMVAAGMTANGKGRAPAE